MLYDNEMYILCYIIFFTISHFLKSLKRLLYPLGKENVIPDRQEVKMEVIPTFSVYPHYRI
jgi:hypothetical protein